MNPMHNFHGWNMREHIHESNLIENVDDPAADDQSLIAWRYLSQQSKLDLDVLLDLHAIIMKDQLPSKDCGKLRTIMVTVGGRPTPEPYLAQQILHNWLYTMQYHIRSVDPLEMHIKFEHIHPFIDGNGRTGRMLLWWHEIITGERPTKFAAAEKERYYELFNK